MHRAVLLARLPALPFYYEAVGSAPGLCLSRPATDLPCVAPLSVPLALQALQAGVADGASHPSLQFPRALKLYAAFCMAHRRRIISAAGIIGTAGITGSTSIIGTADPQQLQTDCVLSSEGYRLPTRTSAQCSCVTSAFRFPPVAPATAAPRPRWAVTAIAALP